MYDGIRISLATAYVCAGSLSSCRINKIWYFKAPSVDLIGVDMDGAPWRKIAISTREGFGLARTIRFVRGSIHVSGTGSIFSVPVRVSNSGVMLPFWCNTRSEGICCALIVFASLFLVIGSRGSRSFRLVQSVGSGSAFGSETISGCVKRGLPGRVESRCRLEDR